jgi:DNA relaxase NicK
MTEIDVKVDWFAFTVPLVSGTKDQSPDTVQHMRNAVNLASSGLFSPFYVVCEWELRNVAGFYAVTLIDQNSGFRMSWGDVNKHVYVELPGKACTAFSQVSDLPGLISVQQSRCSRIDLAGDWLTDVEPRGIIGNAYESGRRAFSQIRSHEGLTVYVGSRKSERFMRVYRYAAPHPRHEFLRIEHEYKGATAKTACATYLGEGCAAAFSLACNSYNWDDSRVKEFSFTEGKISSTRTRTDKAATLLWLMESVAPSLAKAAKEGVIDLDEFIESEVRPLINRIS